MLSMLLSGLDYSRGNASRRSKLVRGFIYVYVEETVYRGEKV